MTAAHKILVTLGKAGEEFPSISRGITVVLQHCQHCSLFQMHALMDPEASPTKACLNLSRFIQINNAFFIKE